MKLGYAEFTYARWDWMTTHSYLDENAVGKIGLWKSNNKIVGIATFDTNLGNAYCLALPEFRYLKKEMLLYSKENLSNKDGFGIVISDTDYEFQDIAYELGYIASEGNRENDLIFYINKTSLKYELPNGFKITSLKETYDEYQYMNVLWKGFNHELNGEGKLNFTEENKNKVTGELCRPNVDLDLKIAVISPNGDFASYCGMWYEAEVGYAIIEPVATDPNYRKMGLGKAAVLEGIKRVKKLGAKTALVGSGQQFYYNIGMRPYSSATIWMKK
ncbi:MAG: GNAT family N-acetyltransferase [Clostridiales bacterium]